MNCDERREKLFLHSSGELQGPEKAEMDAHLETCELCRCRLAGINAVASCLRKSLAEPVECPDLTDSVMAILLARGRPLVRRPIWAWGACATLALAVAFGWQLWRSGVQEPPQVVLPPTYHSPKVPPLRPVVREPEAVRAIGQPTGQRPVRSHSVRRTATAKLGSPPERIPAAPPLEIRIASAPPRSDGDDGHSVVTATVSLGGVAIYHKSGKSPGMVPVNQGFHTVWRPPLEPEVRTASVPVGVSPGS